MPFKLKPRNKDLNDILIEKSRKSGSHTPRDQKRVKSSVQHQIEDQIEEYRQLKEDHEDHRTY